MYKISIITPTFNRCEKVTRSIDSSLQFSYKFTKEIIIIDDCSTDNTISHLEKIYQSHIHKKELHIISLTSNIGVTGAKNKGVENASGEWLVFMDSDDYFDLNSSDQFLEELNKCKNYDILFFRCRKQDQTLIGSPKAASEIVINELLNQGTPGECLPVIRKNVISKIPYKTYLRGGEAITYLEILNQGYKAYISDLIVRVYDDSGDDRLCTKKQLNKRAKQLIQFNLLKLKFVKYMTIKTFLNTIARVLFYSYLQLKNK